MKRKRPLPTSLSRLHEPLHVREAEVAADVMDLEVVAPRAARAHGLDAEHGDALLAEPGGGLLGQARKVRQIAVGAIAAAIEVHVQEDGVLRLDGNARGLLRLLEVLDRDVRLERLVREVEADGLGEEVLERHLVDALGARPRIEVHGSVDVRAGVVANGQRQRGGGELVAVGLADFLMRAEGRDDDGRMRHDARHLVIDLTTEVDELHGSSERNRARMEVSS